MDSSVLVSNIARNVEQAVLYELFFQCGPIENITMFHGGAMAKITYVHREVPKYTIDLLNGTQLNGQPIFIQPFHPMLLRDSRSHSSRR
ncbi:hypothetical protein SNEBB_002881 [Seison nebaliae]|nr:hypothetical protein SNEBB_002881 [Seison nebaliae]